MHPPALVLPASVRKMVHPLSLIILLRMSAAVAVSLDVNDMSRILSITGIAFTFFISKCLTGSFNKSFFFMFYGFEEFIMQKFRMQVCRNAGIKKEIKLFLINFL